MAGLYAGGVYERVGHGRVLVLSCEKDEDWTVMSCEDGALKSSVLSSHARLRTTDAINNVSARAPGSTQAMSVGEADMTSTYFQSFMGRALDADLSSTVLKLSTNSDDAVHCRFFAVHTRSGRLPVLEGNACNVDRHCHASTRVFLNARGVLHGTDAALNRRVYSIEVVDASPLATAALDAMWELYGITQQPLLDRVARAFNVCTVTASYLHTDDAEPATMQLEVTGVALDENGHVVATCRAADSSPTILVFKETAGVVTCTMRSIMDMEDEITSVNAIQFVHAPSSARGTPCFVERNELGTHKLFCQGTLRCSGCDGRMDTTPVDLHAVHAWRALCMACTARKDPDWEFSMHSPITLNTRQFNDMCAPTVCDRVACADGTGVCVTGRDACDDCTLEFGGGVMCVCTSGALVCSGCALDRLYENSDVVYGHFSIQHMSDYASAVYRVRVAARAWGGAHAARSSAEHAAKLDVERAIYDVGVKPKMDAWACTAREHLAQRDGQQQLQLLPHAAPAGLEGIDESNVLARMLAKYPDVARTIASHDGASELRVPSNAAWENMPPWLFHELDRCTGRFADAFVLQFWDPKPGPGGVTLVHEDAVVLPSLQRAVAMALPWLAELKPAMPRLRPCTGVTCPEVVTACVGCDPKTTNITVARVVTDCGPVLVQTSSKHVTAVAKAVWERNFEELCGTHSPAIVGVFNWGTSHSLAHLARACAGRNAPDRVAFTIAESRVHGSDGKARQAFAIATMFEPDTPNIPAAAAILAAPGPAARWADAVSSAFKADEPRTRNLFVVVTNAYAQAAFVREAETCPWGSVMLSDTSPRVSLLDRMAADKNTLSVTCDVLAQEPFKAVIMRKHTLHPSVLGKSAHAYYLSFFRYATKDGQILTEIAHAITEDEYTSGAYKDYVTSGLKKLDNSEYMHTSFAYTNAHIARCPFDPDITAVCFTNDPLPYDVKRACIRAMMNCFKGETVGVITPPDGMRVVISRMRYDKSGVHMRSVVDTDATRPLPPSLPATVTRVQPSTEFTHAAL